MATVKFSTYLAAARQETRLREWQEETKKKDATEFLSRPFEVSVSERIMKELAEVYRTELKLEAHDPQ